eukprot:5308034-Prorocentrum_lima.AAC.1
MDKVLEVMAGGYPRDHMGLPVALSNHGEDGSCDCAVQTDEAMAAKKGRKRKPLKKATGMPFSLRGAWEPLPVGDVADSTQSFDGDGGFAKSSFQRNTKTVPAEKDRCRYQVAGGEDAVPYLAGELTRSSSSEAEAGSNKDESAPQDDDGGGVATERDRDVVLEDPQHVNEVSSEAKGFDPGVSSDALQSDGCESSFVDPDGWK